MNIKTDLLNEYIDFVDNTKKQNRYFKIIMFLILIIMFLFLFKHSSNYKKQKQEYILLYNIK